MASTYIRTKLATDWEKPSQNGVIGRLLDRLVAGISANPNYENALPLVKEWLIEFKEDDLPFREIGLDDKGAVVLAGPTEQDYGFWLDTNMKRPDFKGREIPESEFEAIWAESKDIRGIKR